MEVLCHVHMWNKASSFAYKLWILTFSMDNHFFWEEGKVSLIFTNVYIVLVSVYLLIILYLLPSVFSWTFPIHMVMTFHLWLQKSAVYWGISSVKPLLNGRESSIIAEALCSLGHHISQRLCRYLGMENLIVAFSAYWDVFCHRPRYFCACLDCAWQVFCRFSHPGSEG